jgi:hypothetical protein
LNRWGHVDHARRKTWSFDCRVMNDPDSRTVHVGSRVVPGEIAVNQPYDN